MQLLIVRIGSALGAGSTPAKAGDPRLHMRFLRTRFASDP